MKAFPRGENIPFHAARLLILLQECGHPRRQTTRGIRGRVLLAKLDFFVRYPSYLERAVEILGQPVVTALLGRQGVFEAATVESRMVRYLYGPWDHSYYRILAYLIAKGLLETKLLRGAEEFRLTGKGVEVTRQIAMTPEYSIIVERARVAYRLFRDYNGSRLKQFIYDHFPDVVARPLGAKI